MNPRRPQQGGMDQIANALGQPTTATQGVVAPGTAMPTPSGFAARPGYGMPATEAQKATQAPGSWGIGGPPMRDMPQSFDPRPTAGPMGPEPMPNAPPPQAPIPGMNMQGAVPMAAPMARPQGRNAGELGQPWGLRFGRPGGR